MKVKIGDKLIGDDEPCFVIAEIGINHNGSLDIAKKLILRSYVAGCDAVKFQKRTVEDVYSPEELAMTRESPFGTTNGDLKRGLELSRESYNEIDRYCAELGIMWFASCWDLKSLDFMEKSTPPCHKVASPMLTNIELLKGIKRTGRPVIMSTGMSTLGQIDKAVDILGRNNIVLLHTTSTYPSKLEELNLNVLKNLAWRYRCPIGYSGHEVGIVPSVAAVVMGAKVVERHVTLDRAMWGTDQAASVEPLGIERLVKYIHDIETCMGDGIKRIYDSEVPIMRKLRKI